MREYEPQTALREVGARGPKDERTVALLKEKRTTKLRPPKRGRPTANVREAEAALHAAGKEGADRLRAAGGIDLSAPVELAPRSRFGGMVSRLMERKAATAGLSLPALMAAAGKTGPRTGPGQSQSDSGLGVVTPTNFDPLLVLLVNRVTGGFLFSEYLLAKNIGFDAYLSYHLNHTAIPDPGPAAFLAGDPTVTTLGDPALGYLANCADDNSEVLATLSPNGLVFADVLQAQTIYRKVLTKRFLHERMTEFWTDHFNIDLKTFAQGVMKPVDDREVIRANALGDFPTMLTASAHSASMLFYLDQALSSVPIPNQNYARELLELHTVGEGNGYNEDDVADVSFILAGWSANFGAGMGQFLTFQYKPAQHLASPPAYSILKLDPNPIAIAPGGESQGDQLLAGLAAHANTATYVSTKMLRFLLQYEPTAAQITAISNVYLSSGGDIKQMITAILTPANLNPLLATSPTTLKVKRPTQLMATFLRSVEGTPFWEPGVIENPILDMTERLESLGNAPHVWGPPNGYPDAEGAWIGSLLGRWDLLDSLMRNEIDNFDVDYLTIVNQLGPFTVPTLGFTLNALMTGGAMTADEQFWLQEYVDITVILLGLGLTSVETLIREYYAVAGSAPSYQYY